MQIQAQYYNSSSITKCNLESKICTECSTHCLQKSKARYIIWYVSMQCLGKLTSLFMNKPYYDRTF